MRMIKKQPLKLAVRIKDKSCKGYSTTSIDWMLANYKLLRRENDGVSETRTVSTVVLERRHPWEFDGNTMLPHDNVCIRVLSESARQTMAHSDVNR